MHYLQTHHIPLPIDLFPEAISNLHTLLCNFGIEHHALITTPGTTVELDVGDGDSDCDDADQSPVLEYSLRSEHVTASEPEPSPDEAAPVVAPPLEVVVPTWVHETLLAGVGELYPLHVPDVRCTALATAYERISIAKQAQFTCALICCGIGTALFFQRWLQPQLHGSRWMCSSLPIKIELVCEINSDQRDFMRKYLPKGARILDDLRAVVHGFRNSTLDPRDYYTDFVELTAPCYANTPLRHHNNAAEHNDKDLFLLAVEYCWWIRPRRCVFGMTPEYGHAYEDHQQVVKAMHQCDLHPQVTPRFPSCYCGDATHRDRFVANCSTQVSPSFELLDYCESKVTPFTAVIDPLDAVPDDHWCVGRHVSFTRAVLAGENQHCSSDMRFEGKRDLTSFSSRSLVVGYIDGSHAREDKVYSIDFPVPTITSFHMRVLDTRRLEQGYELRQCVRFVTLRESIRASSFFPEQERYAVVALRRCNSHGCRCRSGTYVVLHVCGYD